MGELGNISFSLLLVRFANYCGSTSVFADIALNVIHSIFTNMALPSTPLQPLTKSRGRVPLG